MDYNTGSVLWKKQWDKIHDPATVLGLFEEDQSGESVGKKNGTRNYIIGGADLFSDGMSNTTATIAKRINGIAYNVTWGNVGSLTDKIISDIQGGYVSGQIVNIYGYSEGGNIALQVSRALNDLNIPISILFTVDAADGPFLINHSVSANVSVNFNFYQTTPSNIGSHGEPNSGLGKIYNVNVTAPSVTHGNIDELMMNYAIKTLGAN